MMAFLVAQYHFTAAARTSLVNADRIKYIQAADRPRVLNNYIERNEKKARYGNNVLFFVAFQTQLFLLDFGAGTLDFYDIWPGKKYINVLLWGTH
jgi:hypothetical protein